MVLMLSRNLLAVHGRLHVAGVPRETGCAYCGVYCVVTPHVVMRKTFCNSGGARAERTEFQGQAPRSLSSLVFGKSSFHGVFARVAAALLDVWQNHNLTGKEDEFVFSSSWPFLWDFLSFNAVNLPPGTQ